MSGIEDKLADLGYPRPPSIDLDSDTLRQELESVAPTLASFAARGWLVAFDFDAVAAPEWVGDLLRALLDGAGHRCQVTEHDDGSVTVQVDTRGARRFELSVDDGEDAIGGLALAAGELGAALLAEQGWQLVWDNNGDEILLAAVPDRCWQALDDSERGALQPIEPKAHIHSEADDDKLWN
ncbi:MAG: hypothetical protein KJO07_23810 [Deltaproteobacteria bacterium]|jgi:hypothetical protein|nr:hypothetical protein [Deltaproteobacteria bacterium]